MAVLVAEEVTITFLYHHRISSSKCNPKVEATTINLPTIKEVMIQVVAAEVVAAAVGMTVEVAVAAVMEMEAAARTATIKAAIVVAAAAAELVVPKWLLKKTPSLCRAWILLPMKWRLKRISAL